MKIQWFGTAGFRITSGDNSFLIDPYLTRNKKASPVQPNEPWDVNKASHIFISHGHFDHILDVPEIANRTRANVFCSDAAADSLIRLGLEHSLLESITKDRWERDFDFFKAESFYSEHVKFDKRLLICTLLKINLRLPRYLPLLKEYPCGQVLSWRFTIEGKTIHFFGSAGSSKAELESLAEKPVDILLVPLQGHTDICDIAADYVKVLQPKIVIPHHQDDFFPPISKMVDIQPFMDKVLRECPDTKIERLNLNETLHLG